MKGIILGTAATARIVDISHEVPAGDLRAGAFTLAGAYACFPKGTIHVVVVDPGVGSRRQAIAVQTQRYRFVGPDNGVLSLALAGEKVRSIRSLQNESLFQLPLSRTFHGRDIFAPVAAHLSKGTPFSTVGPPLPDYLKLPWPQPEVEPRRVRGEIVFIDHFGNAMTNISDSLLAAWDRSRAYGSTANARRIPFKNYYEEVPVGRLAVLIGSSGFLEVAVHRGSAAERLGLKVGDPVRLQWKTSPPKSRRR